MQKNFTSDLEIIIDPEKLSKNYFTELSRCKELFFYFVWRDILVRYKQALLGVFWAILRPLLNMALFAFIFGLVARFPSEGVSYPLFVLGGMIVWLFCAGCIIDSVNSISSHAHLISKVYMPRIIIPMSQIAVHTVDFLITLIILTLALIFTDHISWTYALVPAVFILNLIFCMGTGFWLSALGVRYRDVKFLVAFFVQFGMFLSPVGYGTFMIPQEYIHFYALNPVVGIIDSYRFAFYGITNPYISITVPTSIVISLLLLITGFFYFRKTESTFVDSL